MRVNVAAGFEKKIVKSRCLENHFATLLSFHTSSPALNHTPQLPPEVEIALKGRHDQRLLLLLQLGQLAPPFQKADVM